MLNRLEPWLGRFAIPHLALALTMGLSITFGMHLLWPETGLILRFDRQAILNGEVWRLITFLILSPRATSMFDVLFGTFGLYLFFLMGTALENEWGEFRFNLYILVGWLATMAVGFFGPEGTATNAYALGSVFLAFAYLYPDFELMLFFILPVKIKWLALVTWLFYGGRVVFGSWTDRGLILAAVLNFLLFFGVDIFSGARAAKRRMEFKAKMLAESDQPFHRCEECGATDATHPQKEFRVCEECSGDREYCLEHIDQHVHKQEDVAAK